MAGKLRFRVHSLDSDGRVVSKRDLKSDEQVQAVREAMALAVNCSREVWSGTNLIVHIDPRRGPTVPLSPSSVRSARRAAQGNAQHR